MDAPIKVAVVDDHSLFREGVIRTLQASPSFIFAGEGESAEDALRLASDATLDILVLDLGMSKHGLRALKSIRLAKSHAKIVILTASDEEEAVMEALRDGAHGYILKDISGAALREALELVHRGEPYITPTLASRLLSRLLTRSQRTRLANSCVNLTPREREVLAHLSEGMTNQEIALKLGLKVKTIKQFTMLLFAKMGVRNRVEAMGALRSNASAHARMREH